jgi:transposase
MNEGYRWKKKLFSAQGRALLEKLSLAPWASRRRKELLELLDQLDPKIAELTAVVEQEANQRSEVVRLMTHPGVGPITGLDYVLVIGTPDRFPCGKQIGGYIGLIRARTPVPASSDWGTSVSKAMHCCATCWEKQRKQRHGVTRTGDVGTFT